MYFSNDKFTIAGTNEVEDIDGGVVRLKMIAQSYAGKVDRETSNRELKSALQREYTYPRFGFSGCPVTFQGRSKLARRRRLNEGWTLARPISGTPS